MAGGKGRRGVEAQRPSAAVFAMITSEAGDPGAWIPSICGPPNIHAVEIRIDHFHPGCACLRRVCAGGPGAGAIRCAAPAGHSGWSRAGSLSGAAAILSGALAAAARLPAAGLSATGPCAGRPAAQSLRSAVAAVAAAGSASAIRSASATGPARPAQSAAASGFAA